VLTPVVLAQRAKCPTAVLLFVVLEYREFVPRAIFFEPVVFKHNAAVPIATHAVFKQSLSPAVYRCLDVRATACCDRTMQ
jgi:hypothetical protein